MAKKRPVFFWGTRYNSIVECAERTGIARERLRHALRYSKRIVLESGEVHVDYADKAVSPVLKKSVPKVGTNRSGLLLPGLCTHRLGTYHGGWW